MEEPEPNPQPDDTTDLPAMEEEPAISEEAAEKREGHGDLPCEPFAGGGDVPKEEEGGDGAVDCFLKVEEVADGAKGEIGEGSELLKNEEVADGAKGEIGEGSELLKNEEEEEDKELGLVEDKAQLVDGSTEALETKAVGCCSDGVPEPLGESPMIPQSMEEKAETSDRLEEEQAFAEEEGKESLMPQSMEEESEQKEVKYIIPNLQVEEQTLPLSNNEEELKLAEEEESAPRLEDSSNPQPAEEKIMDLKHDAEENIMDLKHDDEEKIMDLKHDDEEKIMDLKHDDEEKALPHEEEAETPLPDEEKFPSVSTGEGLEQVKPEQMEEEEKKELLPVKMKEVKSENPDDVVGEETEKMAMDMLTGTTKKAARKGAKSHKKVLQVEDEAEDMEVDMDGPSKAAGKRGAKGRKSETAMDASGRRDETESGKKRGRPRTSQGGRIRGPPRQKEDEESLCFICFDGGDLVVCDHRGCPKVYHPSCVNRDDAYFQAKGKWNCGWHICSNCEKSARYMCYTCTYSLCKGCIKEAGFIFVRGNKGFCETCIKTVMLIETNEHEDETMAELDFDDKNSWLYLFKDYWVELKEKLSLTLEELTRARTQSKGSTVVSQYGKPIDNLDGASDDQGGSSSSSPNCCKENVLTKKARKRSRKMTTTKEDSVKEAEVEGTSSSEDPEWASKELVDFVAHVKDGDRAVLSQLEVQTLILQYIRENNLRDPRRRGQIRCDSRLWTLFGKSRVGHLEMLKLLESHLLLKEASPLVTDDNHGGVVDPDPSQMEGSSDASTKIASDMRRKSRRRLEEKEQAHVDDYAAIDVHNISFMYLRRNLMEDLLNDIDTFNEKVVGSFVRIRISASGQKQDLYRLVQVVGTGKAAETYKTGKRATDITLEILNLDKREFITMDIISNQDFTEEECKRLRQSVKCGLIDRLRVGEVQEKARALQDVRVNDWLESEKLRLGHLRDRASEKGRRKDLRECVEKLQLLNTPEEHIRRLNEVPNIHPDPHMDPDYESAEDEDLNFKKRDVYNRPRESLFRGRDGFSAGMVGSTTLENLDKRDSNKGNQVSTAMGDNTYELPGKRGDRANQMNCAEAPKLETNATGMVAGIQNNNHTAIKHFESSSVPPETTSGSLSANAVSPSLPSETEKMWHYQDPTGKNQGPFSMTQLKKWNTNGFFPTNLRIWRTSEKQEDSILLADALVGKFHKDLTQEEPQHNNTSQPTHGAAVVDSRVNNSHGGWKGNNNQIAANVPAMGDNSLTKADRWTSQPSFSSVTDTGVSNPVDRRSATSSSRWESSNTGYAWRGQHQGHSSPRTTTPFSRNSSQQSSYQGRDDRGNTGRWNDNRGRQNNWNSNRPRRFQPNARDCERQHPYRSSSSQQFSGEQWKSQPATGSSNQLGNSSINPSAPIPPPSNIDWTSLQGALNKILPPAASAHPMSSALGTIPGSNESQQSFAQSNESNHLSQAMYSVGGWPSSSVPTVSSIQVQEKVDVVSNLQMLNKPSEGAASNVLENQNGFSGSNSTEFNSAANEKHMLKSDNIHPTPKSEEAAADAQPAHPQLNGTSDPSVVPSHELDAEKKCPEAHDKPTSESRTESVCGGELGPSSGAAALGSTNLPEASVPPQKLEASSSSQPQPEPQCLGPVSIQQQALSGPSGLSVSPAPPLNAGWGVASQNPNLVTGTAQEIGNMIYGPSVHGSANMGWGVMPQGVMNMAWGTLANLNMGWNPAAQVIPNANLGVAMPMPAQGNANLNLAWGPAAQGNTNPNTGFAAPMHVNPTLNPGWVMPALPNTNPNPGWVGPPAGSNAIWGNPMQGAMQGTMNNMSTNGTMSGGNPSNSSTQPERASDGHSGRGDGGIHSNSGGRGGPLPTGGPAGICRYFHETGFCKKGASCNYIH